MNLVFVENNVVGNKIKHLLPSDFSLIPLKELFSISNYCEIKQYTEKEQIQIDTISQYVKNAHSIYILFQTEETKDSFIIYYSLEYFNINFFYKVEINSFEREQVQSSFDNAIFYTSGQLKKIRTDYILDKIINCEIASLLKWFFKKEGLLSDEKLLKLNINRAMIYTLGLLVPVEDKIDNFQPEIYQKIGIDYNIKNCQFRVKNNNKYKHDMQDELMFLYNIVADVRNAKVVESFQRDTLELVPKKPLITIDLQKNCNLQFGYEPKLTMQIAKELYQGIEINGENHKLITSPHTNSREVSQDKIFEVNNFIKEHYGDEYLFMGDRGYGVKESPEQKTKEAILPFSFSKEFAPKSIEKYLSEEQFRVYNYIFERTLGAFMINAVIDTTEVIVSCAGHKFKAVSNKIIKEGWLLFGKYWADTDIHGQEVDLPDNLYQGQILSNDYCMGVVIYDVKERRPMRYGTGRLIEKLTKSIGVSLESISELLDILISEKFIEIHRAMIYPNSVARQMYYFLEMYIPEILQEEFYTQTNAMLNEIENDKLDASVLIAKYKEAVDLLKQRLGYESAYGQPEKHLIDKALSIAKRKGQQLSDAVLSNGKVLMEYVVKNDETIDKLGVCPKCKRGAIYEYEKGFMCSSSKCNFALYNNNIASFFKYFQKLVPQNNYKEYVRAILQKGKCRIEELYSTKKEKFFIADVEISFSPEYKNWRFTIIKNDNSENNMLQCVATKEEQTLIAQANCEVANSANEELLKMLNVDNNLRFGFVALMKLLNGNDNDIEKISNLVLKYYGSSKISLIENGLLIIFPNLDYGTGNRVIKHISIEASETFTTSHDGNTAEFIILKIAGIYFNDISNVVPEQILAEAHELLEHIVKTEQNIKIKGN